MRVHIGSDHGGVDLREFLQRELVDSGHEIGSVSGPATATESCDYPDIAHAVCQSVLEDQGSLGVLVCGTGQGMAMAANSVPGVRAGVVGDAFSARMIREHNDANIICIGARVTGNELARVLMREYLASNFAGGRHRRRVGKIKFGSPESSLESDDVASDD